jgi:hypothetical protein
MQLAERKNLRSRLLAGVALLLTIIVSLVSFYIYERQRQASALQLSQEAAKSEASRKATQDSIAALEQQLSQMKAASAQSQNAKDSSAPNQLASALPLPGNDPTGKFGVVVSDDIDLEARSPGAPSAAYEAQLALAIGCEGVTMYNNQGYYQTVVPFITQTDATNALNKLRVWNNAHWKTAYVRALESWCPQPVAQNSINANGVNVPVFLCPSASGRQ